jgi:hypothetical protein
LPVLGDGSSVVVISSLGARSVVGKPGLDDPSILAYASTKGALETLVRNWAGILGPRGIRLNAVAPGVIDTDMSNSTKTEAGREVSLGMQALKRLGKPRRRRRCGRIRGIRCGALDHGCQYSCRWRFEGLTNNVRNSMNNTLSKGKEIKIPGPEHPITISPAEGKVRVTVDGRIVAESKM